MYVYLHMCFYWSYATLDDNALPQERQTSYQKPPLQFLVKGVKTLGCFTELEGRTILLKTPHFEHKTL